MKKDFILPILALVFFGFGCGLIDKLKSASDDNSNTTTASPTPTASAAPTATPSASPDDEAAAASLGKNLLAFGAGAILLDQTSEAADSTSNARRVFDESGFAWQSADNQTQNQSVTLELPARTTLQTVGFDTAQPTYYDGREAQNVRVEISDQSATDGFQEILTATLEKGKDDQNFPVNKSVAGRFVRVTVVDNFGSPKSVLLKEVRGYGEQEAPAPVTNVSGTYKVPGIGGDVHLKQEGNSIIGCFQEYEGILEGTIEGRTMTLVASNKDSRPKGEKTSFVAANVVEGGKKFLSTWWGWSKTPTKKLYDRLFIGEKLSDKIGNCKHMPNLDGAEDAAKSQLEKSLEETGRAVLYGINFDFNSDVIREESKPTLEKVVAILKEKTDWKMRIEGHTDNIGGAAFNQTLSEKRAASVVKYLTGAGIDASRLTSAGFGLSKPVTNNDSEAERAQNRRVELAKQ